LGAFALFLSNMPVDSGLAFILVQHLPPTTRAS
jgi:chemotaxis response regulator CheB